MCRCVPHLPAAQPTADAGKAARPANAASAGEAEPGADVAACQTHCAAEELAHV